MTWLKYIFCYVCVGGERGIIVRNKSKHGPCARVGCNIISYISVFLESSCLMNGSLVGTGLNQNSAGWGKDVSSAISLHLKSD